MAFYETQEFWLSMAFIFTGAGLVWAVYALGKYLSLLSLEKWFHDFMWPYIKKDLGNYERQQALQEISDVYKSFLRERNDFWDRYGQILIAVLIIIVITVLLLTRTISPEAGLPILSGVGGYAIAKSTNLSSQNRPRGPNG